MELLILFVVRVLILIDSKILMENLMEHLEELKNNKEIFFTFMKSKYPVIEKSNLFLRDLQYAIHNYFGLKGIKLGYSESENLAVSFASSLESFGELQKLNKNVWKVNFSTDSPVIENDENNNESGKEN